MTFKINIPMASLSLLDLPLEIRHVIYSYCYNPPYDITSLPSTSFIAPFSDRAEDDVVFLYETPTAASQKCHHANSHLTVIQINRQIRAEAFPFFTASHTLNFSDPLAFANKYLCYMPSQCIQNLRSLNLTWQVSGKRSAASPEHRCIASIIDVKSQIHKVMQVLEAYPELLISLERFGFTLPQFCDYSHHYCRDMQTKVRCDLMRLSVLLCEKVSDLLTSTPAGEEQHFLIEVAKPNSLNFVLWRFSKPVFDQIHDQDIIMKGDCEACRDVCQHPTVRTALALRARHEEHEDVFGSVDEIMKAVRNGKRWNPPESRQYDLSVEKNWKAIFHPSGPRHYWNVDLRYLEARREGSLGNTSKKRKREVSANG